MTSSTLVTHLRFMIAPSSWGLMRTTGHASRRLRALRTFLEGRIGFERPLFSGASLHGHRHLQELDEFGLCDALFIRHLYIGADAGPAANRDRDRHRRQELVLRRHRSISVSFLPHA